MTDISVERPEADEDQRKLFTVLVKKYYAYEDTYRVAALDEEDAERIVSDEGWQAIMPPAKRKTITKTTTILETMEVTDDDGK